MWTPQHLRKIFVGGLDSKTSNESLQNAFSNFGDIIDCIVMKDNATDRSRGFGFITFASPDQVDEVQKARPHRVDGKLVETKRAVPRTEGPVNPTPSLSDGGGHTTRIFIGGLPQDAKEKDLEQYFKHFGEVVIINIMYDKVTGRHRGFAFVDFSDYDHVDKVLLSQNHTIKGKPIDVKKAISKAEVNKLKSLMGSSSKQEPLANMGGISAHSNINTHIDNNNHPGTSAGASPGGLPNENVLNNMAFARMMQMGALGNPFLTGLTPLPATQPPQIPSGWKYQIAKNADILRNTTIEADNESDSSLDDHSMEIEEDCSRSSPTISLPWKPASTENISSPNSQVLFLEPFFGGSHQQLINTLRNDSYFVDSDGPSLFTLPAKKRHWKARTSALYFYQVIPQNHNFQVLFASSTLNLCELLSLRPDLSCTKKIIYFHENQLVYPLKYQNNDYQFGYNQILSCIVADLILFNSSYNMDSFIREIPRFLKRQPGQRPNSSRVVETIKKKSKVLYFPLSIIHKIRPPKNATDALHIIWSHPWDHEKDPETFFNTLFKLAEARVNFRVSVLGESSSYDPPHIFDEARQKLANFVNHFGHEQNKEKYWELLHSGDVIVSTAHYEFFGVSLLDAVGAGCIPLCPNRAVYPEIYPQECLYNTTEQLQTTLTQWCTKPQLVRSRKVSIDLNQYSWHTLRPKFMNALELDI